MLSISLIIFFSVVLFAYWFRYSCLLILQDRTSSYGLKHVAGSTLSFPLIQERLKSDENGLELLDQLHRDLIKDYRVVCFLLRCSAESGVDPIERRMLMLDYWIMRGWYSLARRIAIPQARMALEEMSNIVSHFAQSVGRRATQQSEA
jgi:hypothetical protein